MRKYAVYKEGFVQENGQIVDAERKTGALDQKKAVTWLKSFEASRQRNEKKEEYYMQEVEIEYGEITITDSDPIYLRDFKALGN